jgi:lipoprotein-releasing system permease protein
MALIIVLSAFNGINDLIRSKHNQWDADLKIVPKQGKTFVYSKDIITQLAIPEITTITEILEDNAYVQYNENEVVAKVKGASSNYSHRIKPFISEGEPILYNKKQEQAIIGDWIGNVLNASAKNDFYLLQIWYPKHNMSLQVDPNQSLHKEYIRIGEIDWDLPVMTY